MTGDKDMKLNHVKVCEPYAIKNQTLITLKSGHSYVTYEENTQVMQK